MRATTCSRDPVTLPYHPNCYNGCGLCIRHGYHRRKPAREIGARSHQRRRRASVIRQRGQITADGVRGVTMPESDFDVDKLRAIASGDDLAADVAAAVIRQRVEQ